MPRYTTGDSDDSFDFEIDQYTHSVLFTIVKMDRLREFMELVKKFQEDGIKEGIEYVLTWFPSRGTYTKFNKSLKINQTFDHRMFNKTSQYLQEVDRMDDGSVLVACPIDEFPHFLEKNLTYLVSKGMISCDSLLPQPDDDGFTEVVNVRKIKQDKKRQLTDTLNRMSR
jgi:hypothetical protein